MFKNKIMREIKFRALKDDMSNCNLVYGQLVYDAIGQPRITAVDKSGEGLTFHTCLKGTESQYTGLKDKNGVGIYEGDIIRIWIKPKKGYDYIFQIVFKDGAFMLEGEDLQAFGLNPFVNLYQKDSEVIGNIYSNPELLTPNKSI